MGPARDGTDRIEQRLDCELPEEQRMLYLAELKRSREQVMKAVKQKGIAKSKMHVLAALTRARAPSVRGPRRALGGGGAAL